MASRIIITPGMVFGKLTVLSQAESINGLPYWNCACSCGGLKTTRAASLTKGDTTSCGCYQKEQAGNATRTHGMTGTKEYRAWSSMKSRCYRPKTDMYPNYGGRGITVCNEWKNSFETFFADMGKCPEGLSLDRIDVNGNYEPSNCRWADNYTQARNTTYVRMITYEGRTQCLTDWATELGMDKTSLFNRLDLMSVAEAFTKPVRQQVLLTFGGRTQCVAHWAKELDMDADTLHYRLLTMTEEEALTKPTQKPTMLTFDGRTQSLPDWAREIGLNIETLRSRMEYMSVEEALARPTRKSRNIEVTFDGRTQLLRDWAKELGLEFNTLWLRLKTMSMDEALTRPPRSKKVNAQ